MEHGNPLRRILGRALVVLCHWLLLALAAPAAQANLDVDGDNATTALTDGLLIIRHLFGLSGDALTSGALGGGATRDAAAIASYVDGLGYLDVDGDSTTQALTDGLLVIRHLFGLSGTALTSGALGTEATRTDPTHIAQWIDNGGEITPAGGPLNDTGIVWCSDETTLLTCPVDGYPWQDAQHGRDVTHNDDADGHAGFSFTKLDANGNPLSSGATSWSCVRDNVRGLIWEVKTDDGGLRDMDNSYSWYNPDTGTNGGGPGTRNGGDCSGGIDCDTHGFVQAVNAQGLCASNDWRMPTRLELLSIVTRDYDRDIDDPAVDTAYFPRTSLLSSRTRGEYWSSSPSTWGARFALEVSFGSSDGGTVNLSDKNEGRSVRLVRNR